MKEVLIVNNLEKEITIKGKKKKILTDVSLEVKKGEFIAIVGVSGAGKTTLLNLLSGYQKPTHGEIYLNGHNYLENKDIFRGKIGYVPQHEIIHQHLTLWKTLDYAAQLRLEDSVSKKERHTRIKELIASLELNGKENTYIRNLSGGERKRVSIAVELLTGPEICYLDEPTSGLDANIEKKLMIHLKKLAEQGHTIIMSAHTVSNLALCDRILFMGTDGQICFYGSYQESFDYFKVKEFVDIYELLKEKTEEYASKYRLSHPPLLKPTKEKLEKPRKKSRRKETLILSKRYVELLIHNKGFFLLLLLQAPIMGYLITLVAPKNSLFVYDQAKIGMFALTCVAMWLGLFNSIQEIVKEKTILKKEHMFHLHFSSYLFSKLVVLGILSLIQGILIVSVLNCFIDFPTAGLLTNSAFFDYVIGFFIVGFNTACFGLMISAIVSTTESTLVFVPLYMMLQLLFSGALLAVSGVSKILSYFTVGRWSLEALGSITNFSYLLDHYPITIPYPSLLGNDPNLKGFYANFKPQVEAMGGKITNYLTDTLFFGDAVNYAHTVPHLLKIWGGLGVLSLVFIGLTLLVLKKKV